MIDLSDTFSQLLNINPASSGAGADPRAVMVFTSRLRQQQLLDLTTAAAEPDDPNISIVGTDRSLLASSQFFKQEIANSMPSIAMALNPKSVRFTQSKRFVKKDVRNGSVFFHFTNSKGQNNDILTMAFQGNTGNIDLAGSVITPERNPAALQSGTGIDAQQRVEQDTGALRKLMVWHNLYQLSREPMLLDDNTENEFTISYVSPLFPQPITFVGFFEKVLEFEENAAKPNSRDYSFSFIVTRTEPDLDELVMYILSYMQAKNNLTGTETSTLIGSNNQPFLP